MCSLTLDVNQPKEIKEEEFHTAIENAFRSGQTEQIEVCRRLWTSIGYTWARELSFVVGTWQRSDGNCAINSKVRLQVRAK